jgi:hypothetical protein
MLARRAEQLSAGVGRNCDFDLEDVQGLYALQRGDVIVLLVGVAPLWWFVVRVNGPEQTITAATTIFDQQREEEFSFAAVMRHEPDNADEADHYRQRLGLPLRPTPPAGLEAIPQGSISRRYRWVFAPQPPICHGYANGCTCTRCEARSTRTRHREAA